MTAKILQFAKPEKPLDSEFTIRICSPRTFERLGRAMTHLSKSKHTIEPRVTSIGITKTAEPFGKLEVSSYEDHLRIRTDSGFPETLEDLAGLSREDSLDIAAGFIAAFGHIATRLHAKRRSHAVRELPVGSPTFESGPWPVDYQQKPGSKLTLPYRLAGAIALEANNSGSLVIDSPEPQLHLAALENPLEAHEVKAFTYVLK
jgi:hypothetical protein